MNVIVLRGCINFVTGPPRPANASEPTLWTQPSGVGGGDAGCGPGGGPHDEGSQGYDD